MKKIIPCLDFKDNSVVKGIKFRGVKKVGNVVERAKKYCSDGADELAFLDIAATVEARKTRLDVVRQIASAINIPLTVGGGISSVNDAQALIDAGAGRVSVNTAAVIRPEIIAELSRGFGKKAVVVAIDAKKENGKWLVYTEMGLKRNEIDAIEWAKQAEMLGAGSILPTSIDRDGVQDGYDIGMTRAIANAVDIPVIASGGAGTLEDVYRVLTAGKADAALAASIFHFNKYTVKEVKKYLERKGVEVRL